MPRKRDGSSSRRPRFFALNRVEAAAYVGLSPTTFDKLVKAGHFPKPRRYPQVQRLFWIAAELENVLLGMPYADGSDPDPWAGVGDDPYDGIEL